MASSQQESVPDEVEILGADRGVGSESRSWLVVVGVMVVGVVAMWAATTSRGDASSEPGPTTSTVVDEAESPFWSDSSSGVRIVDLTTMIDESIELPSDEPETAAIVDSMSLPGNYEVEFEFSVVDPRRFADDPVTYSQEILASNPDNACVYIDLRGFSPVLDATGPGVDSELPAGWTEQSVRGLRGSVSDNAVRWTEPEVGLVTVQSESEPIEELVDIAEALVFIEGMVPVLPFPEASPAFESTRSVVFSGPDGGWMFDEAEILIVNGYPGATGRIPSDEVSVPSVVVVEQGYAAALAGVAPSEVAAIRLLVTAGQVVEIPTVVSPANRANALFAVGLDPRLGATTLELVDSEGLVVSVFDLPLVLFPSSGESYLLERSR